MMVGHHPNRPFVTEIESIQLQRNVNWHAAQAAAAHKSTRHQMIRVSREIWPSFTGRAQSSCRRDRGKN